MPGPLNMAAMLLMATSLAAQSPPLPPGATVTIRNAGPYIAPALPSSSVAPPPQSLFKVVVLKTSTNVVLGIVSQTNVSSCVVSNLTGDSWSCFCTATNLIAGEVKPIGYAAKVPEGSVFYKVAVK